MNTGVQNWEQACKNIQLLKFSATDFAHLIAYEKSV